MALTRASRFIFWDIPTKRQTIIKERKALSLNFAMRRNNRRIPIITKTMGINV
jgi:hypothetical protein